MAYETPIQSAPTYLLLLSLLKPPELFALSGKYPTCSPLRAFDLQSLYPEGSSPGFFRNPSKTLSDVICPVYAIKNCKQPNSNNSHSSSLLDFFHIFYYHLICHIFNLVFICLPQGALSSLKTGIFAYFIHLCIPRTYDSVWHKLGAQ